MIPARLGTASPTVVKQSYGSSSNVSSRKKTIALNFRSTLKASNSSGVGGCLRGAGAFALRFRAPIALCASFRVVALSASELAHSLTYSEKKPKNSRLGAHAARTQCVSSHARASFSESSFLRVALTTISASSSLSSGRLIVSRASLLSVAANSPGGTAPSLTRRCTAGAILIDFAVASALSFRREHGSGGA